ncbi:UDP-N-acetylmuramoyl-L-alanyl-D-glutamate--2,6-diaminopimelate ligase [Qingshengfaniella alkalisoli]|uniref:UDP-N-acetylmuramoyl-L-alanyl-D-glutamate--2,6-diaminopimelate ligase n=1 Tax=Qingshengfaniella alkalisoli TaxID=2599296 RepID=A0A5B8J4J5_9RHOB|nr:UDP-N-acetylmuramoyl-L-alanyl-D-glutamate--2,6-diaminopimelate ligase [Qingshengfaniella alkalisoli]QDY69457.1 UDP-N-acetylmuramoyl-L-alanyl-D-glutamate--2,6-diaminopimelate ligase [Qingshengfaniella alkalisoli]
MTVEHRKTLSELGLTALKASDPEITGLAVDSRTIQPGYLFAALPGTRVHGAEFIQYAVRMEAAAVLTDRNGLEIARDVLKGTDIAVVVAEDPNQAFAYAAALWFGEQPECCVAVTGTNGKTSVATFLRQIWQINGVRAANLGTTGIQGDYEAALQHTTPAPLTLYSHLSAMAHAGVDHVAMEASSHGLEQRRLDGVRLVAAGFTNFSQDHLDYHESFEAYFEAKLGLFTRVLGEDGIAVVNIDDPKGADVVAAVEARGQETITVGQEQHAQLRIERQRFDATGQDLRFNWQGRPQLVRLSLIGGFQASNVLLASGLAIAAGADPEEVFQALPRLETVAGRMQLVATRTNGANVFVDYAHTPDALETALASLRPHVMGRIVVVFGAGGDRDTKKRKLMGEAAARHADVLFVTDDNPRSEDPAAIRKMVLEGCPEAHEVGDRAEAILRGVDTLEPGDALLVAGKGHETGQTVGDVVYPFDDAEQASIAVAALENEL